MPTQPNQGTAPPSPAARPSNAGEPQAFAYPAHVTDAENYAWRERAWRRPTVPAGDMLLFEEPGRVLPPMRGDRGGTDCRSHYFLVSRGEYGPPSLRVRHGGGERVYRLGWDERILDGLARMASDERFRMLWLIADAHEDSYRQGSAAASQKYERAFLEGRLRKRKVRGTDRYQVKIVQPSPPRQSPDSPGEGSSSNLRA